MTHEFIFSKNRGQFGLDLRRVRSGPSSGRAPTRRGISRTPLIPEVIKRKLLRLIAHVLYSSMSDAPEEIETP